MWGVYSACLTSSGSSWHQQERPVFSHPSVEWLWLLPRAKILVKENLALHIQKKIILEASYFHNMVFGTLRKCHGFLRSKQLHSKVSFGNLKAVISARFQIPALLGNGALWLLQLSGHILVALWFLLLFFPAPTPASHIYFWCLLAHANKLPYF